MGSAIYEVVRRDMLDVGCLSCGGGVYREVGLHDRIDGTLSCTICRDSITRWMTKREIIQHIQEVTQ